MTALCTTEWQEMKTVLQCFVFSKEGNGQGRMNHGQKTNRIGTQCGKDHCSVVKEETP